MASEWFREELGTRLGARLMPPIDAGEFGVSDHLGWERQKDGRWLVGVWIENGRVHDVAGYELKTALRRIVEEVRPELCRDRGRIDVCEYDIMVGGEADLRPHFLDDSPQGRL